MPPWPRQDPLHLLRLRRQRAALAGVAPAAEPGTRWSEAWPRRQQRQNRLPVAGQEPASGDALGDRATDFERTPTGQEELDRVLGGGIVAGGVVLIGGDPASESPRCSAGDRVAQPVGQVLYVTGEEAGHRWRCARAASGLAGNKVRVLAEISRKDHWPRWRPRRRVLRHRLRSKPCTPSSSAPRRAPWPRCVSARPADARTAKTTGCAMVLVGHVTKGQPRRPARAGAHRGHGAVLRGRRTPASAWFAPSKPLRRRQ